MAIASFGSKTFSVSKNRVYTFDEFSRTGTLNIEEQEVDGQKPSTYIKGSGLDDVSFKVTLRKQNSIDVKKEIDSWMSIKDSKVPYMLIIGNRPVSTNKFLLINVSVSETSIDNKGGFFKAVIQLQFKEFVRPGAKKKETETSSTNTNKSIKRGSSKKRRKNKKRNNNNASTAKSRGRKLLIKKQEERF